MIHVILYIVLGIIAGCVGYHLCLYPLKPVEMFIAAIIMLIVLVLLASLIGLVRN